jgi:hypothetical protein
MFTSDRMGQRIQAGRTEWRGLRRGRARAKPEPGRRTETEVGMRMRREAKTYLFQVMYSSM